MTPGPTHTETITQLAQRFGWRLVIQFGSSVTQPETARDVDIAVLPAKEAELIERGRWLAALETLFAPRKVDLLVIDEVVSPLARFEVFRTGHCLYEAEAGLFSREQDRAFFLYADSEKFRRTAREILHE